MKKIIKSCLLFFTFWLLFGIIIFAQPTERTPFALELPELNTGQLTAPKSSISTQTVNVIKFWILNPIAENIDWGKIKTRINRQASNTACSQRAATLGKIFLCDLNRIANLQLLPKENFLEIEAESRDGQRYYASFTLVRETKNKSSPSVFSGRKFAVIIGVSEYQYNDIGLGNLRFADDDANALNDWLKQPNGGKFNPQDILFLTNKNATLSAVRDSLNRFLTKATENDLVIFFLAGHGTPDPFNPQQLYYLLYDSKVGDLKNTGFPMIELKTIIDTKLKSKRSIFLLDTCHSAGVSGKKIVVPKFKSADKNNGERDLEIDERDIIVDVEVDVKNNISQISGQLFNSTGRAIFSSSDVNETSREGEKWGGGHGVFTWALLEGLKGGADSNSDKIITTEELFSYVQLKVRGATNNRQNPKLLSNLGSVLEIATVNKVQ